MFIQALSHYCYVIGECLTHISFFIQLKPVVGSERSLAIEWAGWQVIGLSAEFKE
jgi:hypothetical protein